MKGMDEMLTVVCWKWRAPAGYRSTFGPAQVETLRNMVARNYRRPHRFMCITDDASGIDPSIMTYPLWDDHANLRTLHGIGNPSCYRRLKAFSADMSPIFGDRFVSLDLDCVITGDMEPVWDRPAEFMMWGDTARGTAYNGSMFMMKTGARRQVWDNFEGFKSQVEAKKAGNYGSDQAWISHILGPNEAKWTSQDGVYSYRNQIAPAGGVLPDNAKIIFFHGRVDPWSPVAQILPWVREHYR